MREDGLDPAPMCWLSSFPKPSRRTRRDCTSSWNSGRPSGEIESRTRKQKNYSATVASIATVSGYASAAVVWFWSRINV